jgi:hypothetical protein
MPIEYVTDPRTGKVVSKGALGFGQPVAPERPPAPRAKPKPKAKPTRKPAAAQILGFGPGGFSLSKLGNDLRYELNRVKSNPVGSAVLYSKNLNKPRDAAGAGLAAVYTSGAKEFAKGVTTASTNAVRAVIEEGQKAGGRGQADYTTSPGGRAVDSFEDTVFRLTGDIPPSQMSQEQKDFRDTRGSLTLGVMGAFGVTQGLAALSGLRFVGPMAQAWANGMNVSKASTWWGALGRLGADATVGELVTTFLDDNTPGSAFRLFGEQADPVKPGMDRPTAARAAFFPNLAAGATLSLPFAAPEIFRAIGRSRAGRRVVQQAAVQPRAELETAGLTQADPETGAAAFTEEAITGTSLREANAALEEKYGIKTPEPAAEPAATPTPEIPSQAMEPGGAVTAGELPTADPGLDPWAIDYDPELPEADVALSQIKNASDAELLDAVRSGGPVLNTLDEQMAMRQPLEPDPALSIDLNAAPTDRLATPITPFAQQWQRIGQKDPQQLLNVLNPEVNPALADRAQAMFGKQWEELTPADAVDTLQAAANEGVTVIPNRLLPGQQIVSTGDLKVDPERFQYKGGTDARGVQRGSSLEGVDRWNTDMEGVVEVWQDPADGNYYVVNGHNRFAKAKELGIPTLAVKELIAESPEQAKTAGALSNIASGGGRPIDAAWFMKGAGVTDPAQLEAMGVPLSPDSGHGLSGFQLSQLPDDILRAVESGQIKERMGRIIGGSGASEESMRGAYRYLLENQGVTEGRLRNMLEMSRQMTGEAQAGGGGDQIDLLKGTPWDQTFNKQMIAVADLADEVGSLLKREKRLFTMADANSAALEAKGSRIDKASAQAVADANARAIDFFQRTWMETGPIRDLLNEGGNRVAAGENKGAIAKQIKNRLVGQLADLMGEQAVTRADVVQEDLLAGGGGQFLPDSQALLGEIDRAAAAYGESIDKGLEMSRQLGDAAAGLEAGARELGDQASVIKELSDAPLDRLDPIDREAMEFFAIQRAIQNGEVRPPETPIPELPMDSGVDLMKVQRDLAENTITDDVVKAMADELDLRDAYRQLDETIAREAEKAARDAEGYDLKTFDEKKVAGALEGFQDAPAQPKAEIKLIPYADKAREAARLGEFNRGKGRWGITEQQWRATFDRLGGVPDWIAFAGGTENWERLLQGYENPGFEAKIKALVQGSAPSGAQSRSAEIPAPPAAFTFPADLSKSAPRYGMAKVEFASDLDRAAYMLRDEAKKSKGESRLIQALEEAGYNITAIRTHGAKVRDAIKGIVTEQTGSAAAPQKAMSLQVPEQAFRGAMPPRQLADQLLAPGTELSHGTSSKAAKLIAASGFRPSRAASGGAILGDGVYFAPDPTYAGVYGDTALFGPVPSSAKILDLYGQQKSTADFAEEIGVGRPADLFDGEYFYTTEQQAAIRQWALDNGYDGIHFNPADEWLDGRALGAAEVVIYKPEVADAIVGANVVGELGRLIGDIDAKTGLPKGLSRKAIKELSAGNPDRAIKEVTAMSDARIAALRSEIDSIKQRAAEEGC